MTGHVVLDTIGHVQRIALDRQTNPIRVVCPVLVSSDRVTCMEDDMEDQSALGVSLCCERSPVPVGTPMRCLWCGESFETAAALLTASVGREVLGLLGPCCLAPCARERFEAECRRHA